MSTSLPDPVVGPPGEPLRDGADRRSVQRARRRQRRRRHRWRRRVIIAVASVVLLAALVGVGGWLYVGYRFGQIHKIHSRHLVHQAAPGKPFDVLVVGSDSRAFVDNSQEAQAFGDPSSQGGQRSDVTMVVRVIPATRQVWVLSVPRDLWVEIPGDVPGISGMNRINVAFDVGPDLLVQTLTEVLGITVNHYVAVNFPGFEGMVDALGGIRLDFPVPLRDDYSGLRVDVPGCQPVNGAEALALVRSRHLYYRTADGSWSYDGQSDFSRIQRQDVFFRAVSARANSSLTNPLAINAFLGAATTHLTIDDTLSEGALISLANTLRRLPAANLHFETLPTTSFTTDGGADVLNPAQPYASRMIAAFEQLGAAPVPNRAPTPASRAARGSVPTTTASPATATTTTTASPTTTTTIPGDVYTNQQTEPWNPTPC